jgi:hypothetical protein
MTAEVIDGFLKQGVLGLVILGLIAAIVALRKDNKELQTKYEANTEKRIAEARESIKVIEQNTSAFETFGEVLKATNRGGGQ